jgi:hypothetical protein
MPADRPSRWSEALREQTRHAIEHMEFMPMADRVFFKNTDGRFATISVAHLLVGRLEMVDRDTGDAKAFANAAALIDAGWAID